MTKAGQQIIQAAQSGIGDIHFFNPFTGKSEPFVSEGHAQVQMIRAAADRIAALEEEIREIKAFLVL